MRPRTLFSLNVLYLSHSACAPVTSRKATLLRRQHPAFSRVTVYIEICIWSFVCIKQLIKTKYRFIHSLENKLAQGKSYLIHISVSPVPVTHSSFLNQPIIHSYESCFNQTPQTQSSERNATVGRNSLEFPWSYFKVKIILSITQ